jgi:CDP-4-dehydro-6-deoxyglucose reductase
MLDVPSVVLLTSEDPADAVVLEARPGEVVLDTIRRAGYTHRFGCRRGGCGICRIQLVEGTTYDGALVASTVLTDEDRARGIRLSCRAVPDTDVVIRMLDGDQLRCTMPWLAGAGQRRT